MAKQTSKTVRQQMGRVRHSTGVSGQLPECRQTMPSALRFYLPESAIALFLFALLLTFDNKQERTDVACRQERPVAEQLDLLQGTLDLLILKPLALEANCGWGTAQRVRQVSRDVLQVGQGSLYPALHRLDKKGLISSEWRSTHWCSTMHNPAQP